MREDWVEFSFGMEKMEDYIRWVYKESGDAPDRNNPHNKSHGEHSSIYGEVISRFKCEEALNEMRPFSYRIKYES